MRTLCSHYINGKFDILGVFRGDPTARLQVFKNAVQTLLASPFCVTAGKLKTFIEKSKGFL